MTRVATLALQTTLTRAIGRAQQALAESNLQLDTGKKVQDYAALGSDTARVLSARSMRVQQDAQAAVAKRVDTTLGFYDTSLNSIDDSVSALKKKLLDAIGTGDSPNLDSAIETAFKDFRTALNTNEAGVPIFSGSRTDADPFQPKTLADMVGLAPDAAFANDGVRATARLGDNIDVQYGIGASDIGTGLVEAFSTLAALGPFGDKLTDAQMEGLKTAMGQIDKGISGVRAVNARNGDMQNQVETLGDRAVARGKLLDTVVGDAEDADMGQVATDIVARTSILNASYGAFQQINGLSLLNFLR
jgi:flagellar hook-associated protein 3 FlgL